MQRHKFTLFGMTFSHIRNGLAEIKPPEIPNRTYSRWVLEAQLTGDRTYTFEKGNLKIVLKLNKFGQIPNKPKEYFLITWAYKPVFYHDLNPWVKIN